MSNPTMTVGRPVDCLFQLSLPHDVERLRSWERYQGRRYFPELDGLRAFSIAIVVAHHMHDDIWRWMNGSLGVTVFFVVSGYLITTLALREERDSGRFSFAAFYIRRAFRILPAYYLTLGLYCGAILGLGMLPRAREGLIDALPYYLSYLQEVPLFFGRGQSVPPFRQAWSLGIEEKFYLAWPILVFGLWKARPVTRLLGTMALIGVFAAAPMLALLGLSNLGRMLEPYASILAGCLVALVLDDQACFSRVAWLRRGIWATMTLLALLVLHFAIVPENAGAHAVYVLVCSAFLVSMLIGRGPICQALSWWPLVMLGRLSYGIYLIHYFALYLAQIVAKPGSGRVEVGILAFVLTLVFSSAMAYAMTKTIEQPLISIGRKLSSNIITKRL